MKDSEQKVQIRDSGIQNHCTSKSTETRNNKYSTTKHQPHCSSSLRTFTTNKTSTCNLNAFPNISNTTKRYSPVTGVCKNFSFTSTLSRKKSILPYRIYKPHHAKPKYINEITKPSKNKNDCSSLVKNMQPASYGANNRTKRYHKRPSLSLSLDFDNSNNSNNRFKTSQLVSKYYSPHPNIRPSGTAAAAMSSPSFLATPLATSSTSTFPLLAKQDQNHEITSEFHYCLPIITSCLPVSAASLKLTEEWQLLNKNRHFFFMQSEGFSLIEIQNYFKSIYFQYAANI